MQSCLTLCDPMDSSSPGSSVHWDSPAKSTGGGCSLLQGIFPTQGLNLHLFVSCIGKHILYCLHHLGSNNAIVRLYSSTNFGPDILLLAAKSIQLDTTFIQKQDGGRGFMFLRAKHTGELQCWEPVYSQGPKVGRIISRLNNY